LVVGLLGTALGMALGMVGSRSWLAPLVLRHRPARLGPLGLSSALVVAYITCPECGERIEVFGSPPLRQRAGGAS